MRTTDGGWIRGKRCGKAPTGPEVAKPKMVCAMCGRPSDEEVNLCYPARNQ